MSEKRNVIPFPRRCPRAPSTGVTVAGANTWQPKSNGIIYLNVAGKVIQVPYTTTDTIEAIRQRVIDYVNAQGLGGLGGKPVCWSIPEALPK